MGLFVAAISSESRVKRKLSNPLIASLTNLIVPAALLISASVLTLADITASFLQYLALLWVLWRCVEPTKQLIHRRFLKMPVEEIDKSFFRHVLLVMSILTFIQMLGSRETFLLISLACNWQIVHRPSDHLPGDRPGQQACVLRRLVGGKLLRHQTPGPQGTGSDSSLLGDRRRHDGGGVLHRHQRHRPSGRGRGLSVGIGFGIKEIISNFISSLWLLFEGSVQPGEMLMINGDPCTVRKLGLRVTHLRRGRDGAELLIPNQNFFTQEAE